MKRQYSLDGIPDKTEDKNTTSHKFKKDLIAFFTEPDKCIEACLEIGTNHGWTTKILAQLFNSVVTIDLFENNINAAKNNNKDVTNIKYIIGDAYLDATYESIKSRKFDAVFIDCIHDWKHVIADINRTVLYRKDNSPIYLIFDDYGHPESTQVRAAIEDAAAGGLTVERYIGESAGYQFNPQTKLIDNEGIILSYGK